MIIPEMADDKLLYWTVVTNSIYILDAFEDKTETYGEKDSPKNFERTSDEEQGTFLYICLYIFTRSFSLVRQNFRDVTSQ